MKSCVTCGNFQGDEAAFCSFCGAKLVSAEKPEKPCLLSNIGVKASFETDEDPTNSASTVDPESMPNDRAEYFFSNRPSPDSPLIGTSSHTKGAYALHSKERRPEIDQITFPDRNAEKKEIEQNSCDDPTLAHPSGPIWCSRKYDDLPSDLTNITLDDLDGKNENSPENIAKKIMSPYK